MNCRRCGAYVNDNSQYCTSCGAVQTENMPVKSVSFPEAIKLFFTRYTDFKGRSRRSEYWWWILANMIIAGVINTVLPDLSWIWTLVILVPGTALCVRRLHDVGKSGWYYLWILLPLAGVIMIIVQFCKDSGPDNQWGPNPKAYRPE